MERTPIAGSWVLPTPPATGAYVRVERLDVAWWFANLDTVVFVALAILFGALCPTWTTTAPQLMLWEGGAVAVGVWGLRLSRTGLGVGRDGIRAYRWWGHRDLAWREIERFGLARSSGRFPRDRLTVHTLDGQRVAIDRVSVPRWGRRALTDDRARAAADSVPAIIDSLNSVLRDHVGSDGLL